MRNFTLHTQDIILKKASEIGVVFEQGFKESVAKILNKDIKKIPYLIKYLSEREEDIFRKLGNLVAEVYLKNLAKKKLLEISPLVDFNQGNFPLGDYRNADFYAIFNEDGMKKALFVELTKERDLLTEDAKGIKYKPSDISISITENIGFEKYFEEIYLKAKDVYKSLPIQAFGELKKLLQVLIYSADYMLKNPDHNLNNLSLYIIYPVKDTFQVEFQNPQFSNEILLEEAKKLLREIRDFSSLNVEVRPINKIEVFKPLYPISSVRKKVETFLFQNSQKGNAVVLLHAPATGKTTATLTFTKMLSEKNPTFFCYFTTRIAIAQKVAEKLTDMGFQVLTVSQKRYKENKKRFAKYLYLEKNGNLASLKKEMLKLNPLPPKLAFSTTFHSIVKTKFGSTLRHLLSMIKIFKQRYPNAEIIIAIDEILGMETSFSSYRDLLKGLKNQRLDKEVRIVIFDASLFSGKNFEEEYKLKIEAGDRAIPPHLTLAEYEKEYTSIIEGIEHRFNFLPSYPACLLKVIHEELPVDTVPKEKKKKGNQTGRALFIEKFYKEKLAKLDISKGAGVYIQSIDDIHLLSDFLKQDKIPYEIIHTLNKPDIKNVEGKVFLFTSALSRGIDLGVEHFFIVVPEFNIETNLAELLQVFYRLRDGKTDDLKEKRIHVIYPTFVSKDSNVNFTRLKHKALFNLINQLLEAYISPNQNKNYKIPIPSVKENFFHTTLLSFVETIRQLKIYAKKINRDINFGLKIDGWTEIDLPKIVYPFAIFPKADLKIQIEWKGGIYLNELKNFLTSDRNIPFETKKRLLEFLNGFENSKLYIQTSHQFAIFLPNLIIPTSHLKSTLKQISSFTRLGYSFSIFTAKVENPLIKSIFNVEHNEDVFAFFPMETIKDFITLPQIPLIFLSSVF